MAGYVFVAFVWFAGSAEGANEAALRSLEAFQSLDAKLPPRRVTLSADYRVTFEQSKRKPIYRQREEIFFTDNRQQEVRVTSREQTPDGHIESSSQHNDFRLKDPERYISAETKEGQSAPWAVGFSDKKQLPDLREKMSDARMGEFSHGDTKPLAEVLKEASEVQEIGNEKVGDSTCVLVKAKTPYGQYSLWLDPESGYQLRRLHVVKQAGDRLWSKVIGAEQRTEDVEKMPYPTTSTAEFEVTLDNVVIKEIDGYPFIVQATESFNERHITGEVVHATTQVSVGEIKCNPDFAADEAFVPKIPNGTRTKYVDLNIPGFVWRDGRPVLDETKGLGDAIVKSLSVETDPLPKESTSSCEITPVVPPLAPKEAALLPQEKVATGTFRAGIAATLAFGLALVIAGAFVLRRAYRRSSGKS